MAGEKEYVGLFVFLVLVLLVFVFLFDVVERKSK